MTPSALLFMLRWACNLSHPDQEQFALFYNSDHKLFEVNGIINVKQMEELVYEFSIKKSLGVSFPTMKRILVRSL